MAKGRYTAGTFAVEVAATVAAICFIFPVYLLVTIALKERSTWSRNPMSPPFNPYFGNFKQAWHEAYLGDALISSIVVVTLSLVILVTVGAFAAYFLARCKPRLGYTLYVFFLLAMVLPFQLGLLPLYQMMRDLGLLGTPFSLVIFYCGYQLPFTVFLYTGYIRALPRAYDEAAKIDGATDMQTFLHVIFPMIRPVTGTVIILNCVFVWNDFMTPLLYLQGSRWATVPVAVAAFVDQEITDWGIVFAALVIGIAPVMALFAVLQRHMMEGFAGGLKA
ncbi:MAG: carbohydrate ABC transporter permease [Rhizobiales bacterium]|nr:carbohydrate ABC transporter permease [Hyphomicrobiales bacterium]